MTLNRSLLAVAAALGLSQNGAAGRVIRSIPRIFGSRTKKAVTGKLGGRYMPHQSHRECARRRGGAAWLAFKRADRARRGLPTGG
jgi:hypothetical protein